MSGFTGHKHSEKTKKIISKKNTGKHHGVAKGTSLPKEWVEKVAKGNKGKSHGPMSEKTKQLLRELNTGENHPMFGTHLSEEHKKKQRLARIKYIENNYGVCYPTYNKKACEFFKSFDRENNTKGRYAMYGDGEYCIKELGYFLDYINFDKKLIIEWDEPKHFDRYGNLKQKDIRRQAEIQNHYPDYEFRRIKQ